MKFGGLGLIHRFVGCEMAEKGKMEIDRNRLDAVVRYGLAFVLRLSLILGGLGFASVFAVTLLGGGIYLIATGHPSGCYALVGGAVLTGVVVMALVLVAVVRMKSGGGCD